MSILLSGSLSYDYIMDFPDVFTHHILPDHIHSLNVCFVVDQLQKNYGGTAGNIAYTMNLLNGNPLMLAPIGKDADAYLEHFKKHNIDTTYVKRCDSLITASAHITTDKENNQITAFYAGASGEASTLHVGNITEEVSFAIIAPTQKEAMLLHAKECMERNISFCFDPGQQITAFTNQELIRAIGQAKFYIVNDYEMKLTEDKTGWDEQELLTHVEVVIKTLGEHGSLIMTKDQTFEVLPCPPQSIDDPTGAGDAYRAGFFTAYAHGHDYKTCGQVGSVAAAYAIEQYGTQNHSFTKEDFQERYKWMYGGMIELAM